MGLIDPLIEAASHTGVFETLPTWTKVVSYLGFPIVVSGVLLYSFMGQVEGDRSVILESNTLLKEHNVIMERHYATRATFDAAMLRTMSQICANGAITPVDRKECAVAVVPQPTPLQWMSPASPRPQ